MKYIYLAVVSALIVVTPVAFADGTTDTSTSTSTSTTSTIVEVGEPPTTTTTAPAVTTTTKPPLTAAQIKYLEIMKVNGMVYNWGDPVPAMEAYRIVARHRGWDAADIKSWEIAIANIMMGESGFCPNVLRGAVMGNPKGCVLKRQGKHSDAGFGQLIGIHYKVSKKNSGAGWLCKQERLCSKWEIIASPYNSMTALLALIERSDTKGWCYNKRARQYHRIACNNPGRNVP